MRTVVLALIVALAGTASTSHAGGIKGRVKAKGAKHHGDAVVYIASVEGKSFEAPKVHARMDQKNLTFIPHVLPILVGTTVDFLNSDDVLHNVFCPDKCADKFNLGTWPKGQVRSYTFNTAGCTPVMLCNVHPEMEAYILVLATPYFGVSAKDGSYSIKDVPAGKYIVTVWHEKLKGEAQEIVVSASGDTEANFEIKK